MAGQGAEYQDQINEWMRGFEALPADRKDNVYKWFATQKIIIENTGLTPEEWFGYIAWAMDNPFDYSFVLNFPERPEEEKGDVAEKRDATRSARELVGAATSKTAPEGPGLGEKAKSDKAVERELYERFMKERLGGGGRK